MQIKLLILSEIIVSFLMHAYTGLGLRELSIKKSFMVYSVNRKNLYLDQSIFPERAFSFCNRIKNSNQNQTGF